MKTIILRNGLSCMVDDDMFDYLNQWKWCAKPDGNTTYATRHPKINGKQKKIYMHRVIMNINDSEIFIDHKDHNGLNNQKSNLRLASRTTNGRNRTSVKNSYSIYLGVSWDKTPNRKKRWLASIKLDKKKFIGYFLTEKEAALAYDSFAMRYFGEFANLNFKS